MQARVDWVLIILGTQVIKKKRLVRPVFPNYLFVSYDYAETYSQPSQTSRMEVYSKTVNGIHQSTNFAKFSILDVWMGSKYASNNTK